MFSIYFARNTDNVRYTKQCTLLCSVKICNQHYSSNLKAGTSDLFVTLYRVVQKKNCTKFNAP